MRGITRKLLCKFTQRIQKKITPKLMPAQGMYAKIIEEYINEKSVWLDAGCGHHILPSWLLEKEKLLVDKAHLVGGLDILFDQLKNHSTVRNLVQGNLEYLPFKNESFTVVTHNMVAEHLENLDRVLKEFNRITKPKGTLIIHTPNLLCYAAPLSRLTPEILKPTLIRIFEGRKCQDVFETKYKANTPAKLTKLVNDAGFKTGKVRMLASVPLFAICPPIAILELLFIKLLLRRTFRKFRHNICSIFVK